MEAHIKQVALHMKEMIEETCVNYLTNSKFQIYTEW